MGRARERARPTVRLLSVTCPGTPTPGPTPPGSADHRVQAAARVSVRQSGGRSPCQSCSACARASCRDCATSRSALSQTSASSSRKPPARLRVVMETRSGPGAGRERTWTVSSTVGTQPGQADLEGGRRQRVDREEQGERVGVAAVGEPEPGPHLPLPEGAPSAQPRVAGSSLATAGRRWRSCRGRGRGRPAGRSTRRSAGSRAASPSYGRRRAGRRGRRRRRGRGSARSRGPRRRTGRGRPAGRQGPAGADDVRADDRRARRGGGQVVRGEREGVAVRQGVREGAAAGRPADSRR